MTTVSINQLESFQAYQFIPEPQHSHREEEFEEALCGFCQESYPKSELRMHKMVNRQGKIETHRMCDHCHKEFCETM